jgi:hypothetical protein
MKATKYSQYLQARENLQYVDTPHWIYMVEAVLFTALIVITGLLLQSYLVDTFITPRLAANPLVDGWFINIAGWTALIIEYGSILFAGVYFIRKTIFFLSTYVFGSERRLYVKTGLLMTRVDEVNYDEIKSIEVNYGFFGRLLGYGKLNLDARFVKDSDIPFVYNPENFVKLINFENDLIKDVNLSFATEGMSQPPKVQKIGETESSLSKREQQIELVKKYEDRAKENENRKPADVIENDFDDAVMDDGESEESNIEKRKRVPNDNLGF